MQKAAFQPVVSSPWQTEGPTALTMPVVMANGTFRNPWPSFQERSFCNLLKWKVFDNESTGGAPKFPTPEEAARRLPTVEKLDTGTIHRFDVPLMSNQQLQWSSISATWCGHASFLVQCAGVNILTDPVWSQRASPLPNFVGPKRMVQPPIALRNLPRIHVVTISHNHYDHLDTAAVYELVSLFNPIFVVPLKMKSTWFASCGNRVNMDRVVELNWWERVSVEGELLQQCCASNGKGEKVAITAVPVQHWTMRSGTDRWSELWCGFIIDVFTDDDAENNVDTAPWQQRGNGDAENAPVHDDRSASKQKKRPYRRMFHSGDTGYCTAFTEIGSVFGPIDFSMIPIGAYTPRVFLAPQHVNPEEAVQIHKDVRSKYSAGMHWGTFILTDEPIDEPPLRLRDALVKEGIDTKFFRALKHGETIVLSANDLDL